MEGENQGTWEDLRKEVRDLAIIWAFCKWPLNLGCMGSQCMMSFFKNNNLVLRSTTFVFLSPKHEAMLV
jgi:hypothetical protein